MRDQTDVVVVGTGAAGLTAALTAAGHGLRVTVLEKAPVVGGTTVVSGGSVWVPASPQLAAAGVADSLDDARTYLRRLAMDQVDEALTDAFLGAAHPMLELASGATGLEFTPNLEHPDYQPQLPGAHAGGRTLQAGLFDTNVLGEDRHRLRQPHSTVPVTKLELDEWGMDTLDRWDWGLIAERTTNGIVGMGTALVGELWHGAARRGARVLTGAPARELMRDKGRVSGVVAEVDGRRREIRARRGVVLATGGYEWDAELVSQFLGRPMRAPASPPTNAGDGLRMAMAAGAALGTMSEAWWGPMLYAVGDTYDGAPLYRPTSGLRALPGGIIVNRRGRRFVDEAMNYNDLGKALGNFDPHAYDYPNLPCWLVFDERFRRSYSVATVTPDSPTPGWMAQADTLPELARRVGIDPDGLDEQVREFNQEAAHGRDPRLHRGESVYDRYRGDPQVQPHRNLRPLEDGPYYAVELQLGCLGTKGGPMVDAHTRVHGVDGTPIAGLYAAGNAAACPFGPGYPGAGATLAAGMAFGWLAGEDLARR